MNVTDGSTSLALLLIGIVAFVAIYVWVALALAAVFRKSGVEAWKAWVPILNEVVLLRLGGLSGWLLLLALVPFVGWLVVWIVTIIACHRIGAAFGFGPGMTVLAALLLPVWATVIGFGTSRWVGTETAGARRTAPEPLSDDDGLPPLPDYGRPAAVYAPITPPPAYGRSQGPAAPPVSQTPMPAAGWTPPPLPTSPVPAAAAAVPPVPPPPPVVPAVAPPETGDEEDPWDGLGLRPADELTDEVTGAFTGAPAPISAVPGAAEDSDDEPVGPRRAAVAASAFDGQADLAPPVTRVPAAPAAPPSDEPWAPARSPMSDPEAFPETSGPVSAIAGAPAAGGPRSARASVSAQHTRPEIPDEAVDEETIITSRRRTQWLLVPPVGGAIALSAEIVIVGRRPVADPAYPGAQLVAIQDGTISKTHARLELRDDRWFITDLDSTNGVLFATVLGTEVEATPGVEVEAGDRFLLGDAEVRLQRSDA